VNKETPAQIIGNRFLFLGLNLLGIFLLLVPISMMPSNIAWPQISLLACLALILRCPAYVPYWLVGIAFLLSDFLLSQPMGLGAFIALAATEFLRRNRPAFIEMLFLGEWFGICMIMLAAGIVRALLLAVSLADGMSIIAFAQQFGLNVIAYPFVVFLVQILFRVNKNQETVSHPVRKAT